jgi:sec-independent protein translocase protein TatA
MNTYPKFLVAAFTGFSGTELLLILIVVLLFFGGTKLPALARGLGLSIKELRNASKEEPREKESVQKDK